MHSNCDFLVPCSLAGSSFSALCRPRGKRGDGGLQLLPPSTVEVRLIPYSMGTSTASDEVRELWHAPSSFVQRSLARAPAPAPAVPSENGASSSTRTPRPRVDPGSANLLLARRKETVERSGERATSSKKKRVWGRLLCWGYRRGSKNLPLSISVGFPARTPVDRNCGWKQEEEEELRAGGTVGTRAWWNQAERDKKVRKTMTRKKQKKTEKYKHST
mmetsp:Transcript_20419/g.68165  ORF Transcript_20419/g.68165 Transcript_20419/m.68165 type:complete len:217 (-) Transcript_20419:352-1002(-)